MPEQFKVLHFPTAGMDVSTAFDRQRIGTTKDGAYAYTTPSGVNVRAYEPGTGRMRGGSRPGLVKYVADRPNDERWVCQQLDVIVGVGYDPPGGGDVQLSASGRVVTVVAVSQGLVFVLNPGDTAWSATTNLTGETPPLNFSGLVYSAANIQKLWFADGTNYVYYDPSDNTVYPWLATAGSLPADADDNTARLIVTWRGRAVVSGLLLDPQNVFMSRAGDPTDFEYGVEANDATQAVALGSEPRLGLIGDVVTCLIPYSDDVLLIGGDHTITMLRGDPLAGGQLDLVTDTIGMAWGQPWCRDPNGAVYFFSNRMGVYAFQPGQQPQRISQGIDHLLAQIDTGTNGIRLAWDDEMQGLHVYVTPLEEAGAATHYSYEARSGAWFQTEFANPLHNPLALCLLDGNAPDDRKVLLGGWDGYVRTLNADAADDDGTPISSSVLLGPFLTGDLDDLTLEDLQAVMAEDSGDVAYEVYSGVTAEAALDQDPAVDGVFKASRGGNELVRAAAHATYVRLSSTERWAMESIRGRLTAKGKVRRRSYN
jgi:hypothetical protein